MSQKFIDTTTHDFKTHFAEYVRLIQESPDVGILVKKHNKPIGIFTAFDKKFSEELEQLLN